MYDTWYVSLLKNRRCKCHSKAEVHIENKSFILIKGKKILKEKKKLQSNAMNHGNKLRHPAHDDEHQTQQLHQHTTDQQQHQEYMAYRSGTYRLPTKRVCRPSSTFVPSFRPVQYALVVDSESLKRKPSVGPNLIRDATYSSV